MSAVAKIPKPNLSSIQSRRLYKHIYISLALAGLSGYALQKFVIDPFDKKVDDFYKLVSVRIENTFYKCE